MSHISPFNTKIDSFLFHHDDLDGKISVYNPDTKKYEKLSQDEIDLIQKLSFGEFSDASFNPYPDYVDYFTGEKMKFPINAMPEPKRRFLPSVAENRKIMKMVTFVRNSLKSKPKKAPQIHDIWAEQKDHFSKTDRVRQLMNWQAPRYPYPSTHESYRPPQEYLFDEEENEQWNSLLNEEKRGQVLPTVYKCLRHVPSYDLISQTYERCLDLYMAPRKRKMLALVEPEDLLKIPSLEELQPFPSWEAFAVQTDRCKAVNVSMHPLGELIATCNVNGSVSVFEHTGILLTTFTFPTPMISCDWVPLRDVYLLSIAHGRSVSITVFEFGNSETRERSKSLLKLAKNDTSSNKWRLKNSWIVINFKSSVEKLEWHSNGDYFLTISTENATRHVIVHQLSKYRSQLLFERAKSISTVKFHPSKPHLFVSTNKHVKVYDLHSQSFIYKLSPGMNLITSTAIYFNGNHVAVGSDDSKVCWFNVEEVTKPYRVIKLLKTPIRSLDFHGRYPLLGCGGEESTIAVVHCKVYSDSDRPPQIIPLKILTPQRLDNTQNVCDCVFSSITPSLYSLDEGGALRLFE